TLERFKARLVARGFSQVYKEDYTDIFAPTICINTLRTFFAIVAALNLECCQYNIKNAFIKAALQERIYFFAPKEILVISGYSLRVLCSLYGLKQAAKDWNTLCKDHLITLNFKQSLADLCLFIYKDKKITFLVYFYKNLRKRFNTKNLGEIKKILGMRITRNRRTRKLFLD
ncbi:Retrovirus-related Pol polyprotein from transposon TNT 1-94, partial [Lachnellula suecica]